MNSPATWIGGVFAVAWLLFIDASPASFAFLAVTGSIVAVALMGKGEVKQFESSACPQEVINSAVTLLGTHKRWAVAMAGESTGTFSYHRRPSKIVAFVLLLFFIVPGIVYLALAGKKESFTVSATPRVGSRTLVQATSNGWRGKSAGRQLESQLGVIAPDETPTAEAPLPTGVGGY
jgi:hypothetical protein